MRLTAASADGADMRELRQGTFRPNLGLSSLSQTDPPLLGSANRLVIE